MSSIRFRIGRQAFLVMALAMLVFSSLPVSPVGAQPINDDREVKVKVKEFTFDCETNGGTASTRPSATDDDKTVGTCKGGNFDGYYCIYTPTTRDCGFTRDADDPGVDPGQTDISDLAPPDSPGPNPSVDQADGQGQHVTSNGSSDDHRDDNHPQKGKKKDKKRGKHGKGRR